MRRTVVVAAAAVVALAIGAFFDARQALASYLLAFLFAFGIALGSLGIALLHSLTGGRWGETIAVPLRAAMTTIPLFAILFLPILFGVRVLYPWTSDPTLLNHAYLNIPFFAIRAVVLFAIWIAMAFVALRTFPAAIPFAGGLLVLLCLTICFASWDWVMSLQPHWFSTIFGFYLVASQALAGFAFLIVIALLLSRGGPMEGIYQPRHFHDWGKLLFAFVMIWMYFSYSQWLITWAGNLPEEISFFLARIRGGFGLLTLLIVVFHFVVPFSLLLSRDLKRNGRTLVLVAGGLLLMRWVELFWQVEPAFHERHAANDWLYVAVPLLIGGVWLFFFAKALSSRPLLPIHDPYLPEAIAHGEHH